MQKKEFQITFDHMSNISIFKDEKLGQQFDKNGYVVMDLFDKETIGCLKDIYSSANLSFDQYFYSSSFIEDMQTKAKISTEITSLLQSNIERHFTSFKKLGAVFLVKPTGTAGEMPIHQDWTVVNESKFSSITIWIPLQKTTEKNGTIKVLPRSHKLSSALRSPTLDDALSSIKQICEKDMLTLEMDIGQAFVFNHALLHSSFPNLSEDPRIAVAFGLVHKNAELMFYHKVDEKVEILNISEDFFLNYPKPGERPINSHLKEEINYQSEPLTVDDYYDFYQLEKPKLDSNTLWAKIKKKLSI